MKKIGLFVLFFVLCFIGFSSNVDAFSTNLVDVYNDAGNFVRTDASGNVYITGYFGGTADFDPGVGVYNLTAVGLSDIFIAKFDRSSNFLWAKSIGSVGLDVGTSLALNGSGEIFYTTGYFQGTADFDPGVGVYNLTNAGISDIFVLALRTSDGSFVWAKKMGGAESDNALSIAVDSYGNILTTGAFRSTADFDPGVGVYNLASAGLEDIFISKLDSSGNFISAKRIGSTGSDTGRSIVADQGFYITGSFQGTVSFDTGIYPNNLTSNGGDDIFVARYDQTGGFLWAQNYGSSFEDSGQSIALYGDNLYITGSFMGTVDFYPGTPVYNLTSAGGTDVFILNLTRAGNFVFAKRVGGAGDDYGTGIYANASGVYITGSFTGTVDFNPGPGVNNSTSNGGTDVFVLKLSPVGNYISSNTMGGANNDYSFSIVADGLGRVYTTGSLNGFSGSAAVYNLTSNGGFDGFMFKLNDLLL